MASNKKVMIPIGRGRPLGVRFDTSASTRRRKLLALTKKVGEKKVIGKLGALAVLNKNVNPVLSAKASADRRFIAARFQGKKRVRFPTGLSNINALRTKNKKNSGKVRR